MLGNYTVIVLLNKTRVTYQNYFIYPASI